MRKSNFRDVYQTTILAATEISREPSSATDSDEAERELGRTDYGNFLLRLKPGYCTRERKQLFHYWP
jgi:hypothetical protein